MARPTSGTNAIRPRPAVARIDATVASTTSSSTTPKMPATSRRLRADELRHAARIACADADVLDRDRHLRQQVEEIDQRDPDHQRARRQRAPRTSSRGARRIPGERVAADDERQVDRRGDRVDDQQADAELDVAAPEPPAAVEERLDVRDGWRAAAPPAGAAAVRSVRRAPPPRRGCATVPPLTTNVASSRRAGPATNAAPNAASATGLAPSAADTAPMISRTSPAITSSTSAPSRSTTRKMPPTTGTASSSFSVPSAMNCTAMSGQFAAAINAPRLSEAFSAGGCGIDRAIVPLAVFCWFSVLSCFRAVSRSHGELAPPARGRTHRHRAGDTRGRGVEVWRFGAASAGASARPSAGPPRFRSPHHCADARGRWRRHRSRRGARARRRSRRRAGSVRPRRSPHCRRPGPTSTTLRSTVYDTQAIARAWGGRPSDIRALDRLSGPAAFFVTPSPLGLRLVHVLPILDAQKRRLGAVAVEHVLSPGVRGRHHHRVGLRAADPVRARFAADAVGRRRSGAARENAFLLRAPGGDPLVEVSMAPADIEGARARLAARPLAPLPSAAQPHPAAADRAAAGSARGGGRRTEVLRRNRGGDCAGGRGRPPGLGCASRFGSGAAAARRRRCCCSAVSRPPR